MYKEKGVKWWRIRPNPNYKLPILQRDIQMHSKVHKVLLWGIYTMVTLSVVLLLHLFTFKHKENIIISDGTIYGCMLHEGDLEK